MPEGTEFILLADDTIIGWIKFNGVGEAPERHMGLLFDGFGMPDRASLGDHDRRHGRSAWTDSRRIRGSTSNDRAAEHHNAGALYVQAPQEQKQSGAPQAHRVTCRPG